MSDCVCFASRCGHLHPLKVNFCLLVVVLHLAVVHRVYRAMQTIFIVVCGCPCGILMSLCGQCGSTWKFCLLIVILSLVWFFSVLRVL